MGVWITELDLTLNRFNKCICKNLSPPSVQNIDLFNQIIYHAKVYIPKIVAISNYSSLESQVELTGMLSSYSLKSLSLILIYTSNISTNIIKLCKFLRTFRNKRILGLSIIPMHKRIQDYCTKQLYDIKKNK